MKTKKLYLWKCHDNQSGAGTVPVYFTNYKAAKEYSKKDYVSYCGKEYININYIGADEAIINHDGYPLSAYNTVKDAEEDNFVTVWGICDNGKLWEYNHNEPK
jgi:hypothetical protein